MEMVYISHPYTGNESENKADVERIRRDLQYSNPDDCYVNPLAMFGDEGEYHQVLAQCFEVLARCNTILFCDGWETSNGCQAEMAFAIQQGKTIEFENGDC